MYDTIPFPPLETTCFAAIDLQRDFCDPDRFSFFGLFKPSGTQYTDITARKIAAIAPEFNRIGMDVAWVYYDSEYRAMKPKHVIKSLHRVKPANQDYLIPKTEDDAFRGGAKSAFNRFMKQHGKKSMFICGVNLNACVYSTVTGAVLRGYDAYLVTDLSADGRDIIRQSSMPPLEEFKQTANWINKSSTPCRGKIYYTNSADILAHYKTTSMPEMTAQLPPYQGRIPYGRALSA